jgi:hypothetical protein
MTGAIAMPKLKPNRLRGRPEKAVAVDLGPAQRLANGTAWVAYRADPENPSRPSVRAAGAKVIYHQLWLAGHLSDEQHEAADRYLTRLEVASGANVNLRGSSSGAGFSPTAAQVAALADLRIADAAIGPLPLVKAVCTVIGWNIWPPDLYVRDFKRAMQRVADVWGM